MSGKTTNDEAHRRKILENFENSINLMLENGFYYEDICKALADTLNNYKQKEKNLVEEQKNNNNC